MRKRAIYPPPKYHDPSDKRLVQIISAEKESQGRSVNVLGVPYDGAALGRKGAAGGPAAIRESMSGFSNYNIELGVGLDGARICDLGDVSLKAGTVTSVHKQIESEVARDLREGSLLAILGGDNSISLPSITALSKKYEKIGLVVLDSHLDLRRKISGQPTSGSSYGLALESLSNLSPKRVVEVGAHGFLNSQKYVERAKSLGINLVTAKDLQARGTAVVAKEAYEIASKDSDAVYLSVDLDVVDLAQVSGVSAPSAGGIWPRQLFEFVFALAAEPAVKCADIVELAPSLDPTDKSQRVAATALVYLIAGFASRKRERR